MRRRLVICRYIWPHMLGMALTYTVTLSLYPGLETLLQSCSLGHWFTILLMVTFNTTDLLGKLMAGMSTSWSELVLVLAPLARVSLVPLVVVVGTRSLSDSLTISLTAVLGLSNGLFGSLPIILAPGRVAQRRGGSELTGNLMTGAYCVGLTLGALAAYLCQYLAGDIQTYSCHSQRSVEF